MNYERGERKGRPTLDSLTNLIKKGHFSWVWLDSTIFKRTLKYGIMKIKSTDNILIERGVTSNRAVVHRTE